MSVLTPSWTSEYNDTHTSPTCQHRPSSSQQSEQDEAFCAPTVWWERAEIAERLRLEDLNYYEYWVKNLTISQKQTDRLPELLSESKKKIRICWCLVCFMSPIASAASCVWDDWGWQKLLQSCPEICQSFLLLGIVILGRAGGICQIRNMSDDKTK